MWDACHERFCPATVHPDTYRNPRRPPVTCAPIIAVVLDTPVGYPDFVLTWAAWAAQRLEEEDRLLRQLPNLPDLQCSWLLLPLIVTPRACDALRTVPPQDILAYTRAHDQAVWQTVKQWLWGAAEPEELHVRVLARLPACFGGLGLHFLLQSGEHCGLTQSRVVRAGCFVKHRCPLLGERAGDEAAKRVACGDAPHAAVRLAQSR